MNGKAFTERLEKALEHADDDFDVVYLGWFLREDPPQNLSS